MTRPLAAALLVGVLGIGAAAAQETSAPPSAPADAEPTVRWSPDANAIRLQIANGLIRLDGETRRAKVNLEWSLLPPDSLLDRRAEDFEEFRFDNAKLATPREGPSAGADDPALLRALQGEPGALNVTEWDLNFRETWNLDALATTGAFQSFDPLEIYGLLRDHSILRSLLLSRGMVFRITVGDDPRPIERRRITWIVRRYTYRRRVAAPRNVFHRYTITAVASDVEIRLPRGNDDKQVDLDVRATLEECDVNDGPCTILEAPEFVFSTEKISIEESSEKIDRLKRKGSASLLETAIEYGTGLPASDVVLEGLRLGSRYASFTGGAAITEKNVDPVVGLDFEVLRGRRIAAGALLGATTSRGGVFAGPSLRLGLLQLSVGALWEEPGNGGEDEGDGHGSLERRWAGVAAIDLPRLLGLKQDLREIRLSRSETGGNWGQAADDVMGDLRLLNVNLWSEDPGLESVTLRMERQRLPKGDPAVGADRTVVLAPFDLMLEGDTREVSRLFFLPGGRYCFSLEEPRGRKLDGEPDGKICPHTPIGNTEDVDVRRFQIL